MAAKSKGRFPEISFCFLAPSLTASGLPPPPTGEQNQKLQKKHALPKPDNFFIRYRHKRSNSSSDSCWSAAEPRSCPRTVIRGQDALSTSACRHNVRNFYLRTVNAIKPKSRLLCR